MQALRPTNPILSYNSPRNSNTNLRDATSRSQKNPDRNTFHRESSKQKSCQIHGIPVLRQNIRSQKMTQNLSSSFLQPRNSSQHPRQVAPLSKITKTLAILFTQPKKNTIVT